MMLDGVPVTVGELSALAMVNYGHFTSMLVTDGRVRGLDLHLQRLIDDCRVLFNAELNPTRVRELIRRSAPAASAVIRVTVFAPDLPLTNPGGSATPKVLVNSRPATGRHQSTLHLRSVTYQRELPSVKHVGLFGSMLQRRVAQRAGADDALFVDAEGAISEGTTWNIGFVDATGQVVWPAGDCLPGVTMRLLEEALTSAGVAAVTRPVRLADAYGMRAAFATNAAVGVRPIVALDETAYAPDHPLLTTIVDRYAAIAAQPL